MRRFFRFSIRDIFWLILVVALGLASFIREKRVREEMERMQSDAKAAEAAAIERAARWRKATGALERMLESDGCVVDWVSKSPHVFVLRKSKPLYTEYYLDPSCFEPSRKED